jgi:hypothetical protein
VNLPSKDQDLVDELLRQMQAADQPQTNGHVRTAKGPPTSAGPSDEQVIGKCRSAENSAKFEALFDRGDTAGHGGDESVADLALLGILTFYTQDAAQLDRIFSASALGRRPKWRNRPDYRRRTIETALQNVGEIYDWGRQGGRRLVSSSSNSIGDVSDDDTNEDDLEVVWFADLGEPKEREYLIEKIGVKGYPIVAFGAGGVAKSFAMLAAGIAIASSSGADHWLGLRVLEHGYVLYLDFELDAGEQHRRVRDLCAGLSVPIPKRLAYVSGVGISPERAFKKARAFVQRYRAKAVIIDSMGLAMAGDMERGRDVLAFHSQLINPLRRAGATPFIVDHEGKLQAGEKHKDKAPIGSAYKAWAVRNVLQFQLEEHDKENSALDIRVRQTKTNFAPVVPFGVRFTFEEKKVSIEPFELEDTELVEEESVPVRERIKGALRVERATNAELQKLTGASAGTIRNNLSELMQAGEVEEDGYKGRSKVYRLVSSPPTMEKDDDTSSTPVTDLFANPPDWLTKQLEKYREDPYLHIRPLCAAVAAAVLGDPMRAPEIRVEVEEELVRGE